MSVLALIMILAAGAVLAMFGAKEAWLAFGPNGGRREVFNAVFCWILAAMMFVVGSAIA